MGTQKWISLPALLALTACSPSPQDPSQAAIAAVTASLRPAVVVTGEPDSLFALADRMAYHKVPGISIAVVDSGRIVWARGFGVKAAGTIDSVTATTRFQAASISKPIAATGMLRLVEEGKLGLDEPVNTYLTSWKLPENHFTATAAVTLRRLVSHSAGVTVHGFLGYAAGDSVPTVAQVLDGRTPANSAPVRVDLVPGTRWRYAGGGTTVMQLAMTDVTGEPFPSLMKRLVLDPMGMTHSTFEQPLPESLAGEAAAAHQEDGTLLGGRWHTYPEMAAAGLWTTPTDLMQWALGIAAARAGATGAVLSRETATQMLTVEKAPSGLGPMLGGSGREFRFGHGGGNQGFRAQVTYFPETGQGAAVMTNSDNGDALVSEVLNAVAKVYHWPAFGPREVTRVPKDSAALAAYAGRYITQMPLELTAVVTREGGKLFIEMPGFIVKSELVFIEDDRAILARGLEVGFVPDVSGAITAITLRGLATLQRVP